MIDHHAFRVSALAAILLATATAMAQVKEPPPTATPAPAAQPAEAPKPQPRLVRLTVSPAPAPRGALHYRLLPEYVDRKPGNRADLYRRGMLLADQIGEAGKKKIYDEIYNRWSQSGATLLPPELTTAQVKERLAPYRTALQEIEQGAWREHCQWGLRLREMSGVDAIALLLPEVQSAREMARLLSLRCRLEIAEGRLEDARKTLQTMYQLARDVAETPTLINYLVGVAIQGVANGDLHQLMQQPDAPNLYWALTALQRPFISLQEAMEQERNFMLQLVPALREANKSRSAEEWRQVILQMFRDAQRAGDLLKLQEGIVPAEWQFELGATAVAMFAYPMAKRKLIEFGRDRKEVEAMPVAQVMLLYAHERFQELWGDMFKSHYLPLPQAVEGSRRADERFKDIVARERFDPMVMLSALLLPAVNAVLGATGRSERAIDELRTIEALRMYAAEHGRWPKSLDEVKQVPIPLNPFTGKPFDYRLEGDKAILEGGVPPGHVLTNAIRYEIKLRATVETDPKP
jgi:hypothetical protein